MAGSQIGRSSLLRVLPTLGLSETLCQSHQPWMVWIPAFSVGDYPHVSNRFVVIVYIVPRYHHHGNGVTVMVDFCLVPGGLVLIINTATARRSIGLLKGSLLFLGSVMNTLLEDWLGLVDLELGLEVIQVVGDGTGIGVTTSVHEAELGVIENFITGVAPVALAATVLLDLFGVGIGETVLAKVLGDMLDGDECAVFRLADVGLVVVLVRASHLEKCCPR